MIAVSEQYEALKREAADTLDRAANDNAGMHPGDLATLLDGVATMARQLEELIGQPWTGTKQLVWERAIVRLVRQRSKDMGMPVCTVSKTCLGIASPTPIGVVLLVTCDECAARMSNLLRSCNPRAER